MFILDDEGWIVEPLQITNLLALGRGLLEEPSLEDEAVCHTKRQQLAKEEFHDAAATSSTLCSLDNP